MIRLKVAAVSSNTNSFGLRNQIFIADNGKAYQAAANYINVKKTGDLLQVPGNTDEDVFTHFIHLGFELPDLFRTPPQNVVHEAFPDLVGV